MIFCPFCKQTTDHLSVDYETEYNNQLCDLIADRILKAIEERTPNFGSERLNKIVRLAIEKQKRNRIDDFNFEMRGNFIDE